MSPAATRIAVLVPCHNEALTVAAVIHGFRAMLPEATIYVYDNNSTDGTAETARGAGAEVRFESRPGKGSVVRRMFADVEAELRLQRDRQPPRQNLTAEPIHHRRQINKAAGHRDVRDVHRPNLVGPIHHKFAEQIRIDLVPRCRFGSARPLI